MNDKGENEDISEELEDLKEIIEDEVLEEDKDLQKPVLQLKHPETFLLEQRIQVLEDEIFMLRANNRVLMCVLTGLLACIFRWML